MTKFTVPVVAGTLLCGAAITGPALAMPVSDLAATSREISTNIQNAPWPCFPSRCWWEPNYWYPRLYAGPYYYDYGRGWYGRGWYGRGWYGHRRDWHRGW
jgi:hypothetical protein